MKKALCFLMMTFMLSSGIAYANDDIVVERSTSAQEKPCKVKFRGLKSVDTLNVTYGTFSSFNSDKKEREGKFVNVKARVRPLRVGKADLGGYFTYTDGNSDNYRPADDRWSYYDYTIVGGGFSGVYHHTKNSETEFEVSWLHQKTDGSVPKKNFWSHQHEHQMEFRVKYDTEERRMAGEAWIPYWDLGVRYVHPYDVSYYDSKGRGDDYAFDNRRLDLWGSFDIYDWYLDDCDIWRISPTFNADLGYLWGHDTGLLQGGFGFKIAAYEEELVDIKLFNPRWMLDGSSGRLYDFIGTWKIDNTLRAIWAAQTEDYISPREKARLAALAAQ